MNLYDKSSVRKEQSQNPSGRNELRGPKQAGLWVGLGQRKHTRYGESRGESAEGSFITARLFSSQ